MILFVVLVQYLDNKVQSYGLVEYIVPLNCQSRLFVDQHQELFDILILHLSVIIVYKQTE